MTSKLIPPNPSEVMVISQISPNITTLSVPFYRFGRLRVGGRGTIVRLRNGSLAVFSPVALTPEVKETVASLGQLRYIVALDLDHHIFLGPWHEAYPDAKVLAPEGLSEKRAQQGNENVPFAYVFTQANKAEMKIDPEFDAEFDYEYVGSHATKELVFNYKPEKTLIEADFLFNLPATQQFSKTPSTASTGAVNNFLTKLFVGVQSTSGTATWQQRFIWYASSSPDRPGFAQSVERINQWDFERIVPCHGDVIESGGKGIFQKVLAWHLDASKKAH
jgi:hypothetical protein